MIRDAPAHPWLQSVRSASSGPRERKGELGHREGAERSDGRRQEAERQAKCSLYATNSTWRGASGTLHGERQQDGNADLNSWSGNEAE